MIIDNKMIFYIIVQYLFIGFINLIGLNYFYISYDVMFGVKIEYFLSFWNVVNYRIGYCMVFYD